MWKSIVFMAQGIGLSAQSDRTHTNRKKNDMKKQKTGILLVAVMVGMLAGDIRVRDRVARRRTSTRMSMAIGLRMFSYRMAPSRSVADWKSST